MNTLPALPGLNAGRFGFLWGGGAAQHLQNHINNPVAASCIPAANVESGGVQSKKLRFDGLFSFRLARAFDGRPCSAGLLALLVVPVQAPVEMETARP